MTRPYPERNRWLGQRSPDFAVVAGEWRRTGCIGPSRGWWRRCWWRCWLGAVWRRGCGQYVSSDPRVRDGAVGGQAFTAVSIGRRSQTADARQEPGPADCVPAPCDSYYGPARSWAVRCSDLFSSPGTDSAAEVLSTADKRIQRDRREPSSERTTSWVDRRRRTSAPVSRGGCSRSPG